MHRRGGVEVNEDKGEVKHPEDKKLKYLISNRQKVKLCDILTYFKFCCTHVNSTGIRMTVIANIRK